MIVETTETELDRGPSDRGVERMCVATRTVRVKSLVPNASGSVTINVNVKVAAQDR